MTHALYAIGFQLLVGLITGDWLTGATLAIGFFVGVEWMQEIRMKLQERGKRWPYPVNFKLAMEGFTGWGSDRYADCGIPIICCSVVFITRSFI